MSIAELACTYAALALHDDGISPTAENISTLIKAANIKVDSFWPSLFAKLLEKKSVGDLISNVGAGGGGGGGAAVAAPVGSGAAAPAAEEKKEEKVEEKEESDDDMGFSLFD